MLRDGLEELLKRLRLEIVGDFRQYLSKIEQTGDGSWEVVLTERADAFAGTMECPVDREEVRVEDAVLCPTCYTPYHVDCAKILASRSEKCWKCDRFDRFDLLVRGK